MSCLTTPPLPEELQWLPVALREKPCAFTCPAAPSTWTTPDIRAQRSQTPPSLGPVIFLHSEAPLTLRLGERALPAAPWESCTSCLVGTPSLSLPVYLPPLTRALFRGSHSADTQQRSVNVSGMNPISGSGSPTDLQKGEHLVVWGTHCGAHGLVTLNKWLSRKNGEGPTVCG